MKELIKKILIEQDTQLTIGDDDGTRRLRIVFNRMKTIEGWDKYIEEIMKTKQRPSDNSMQEPLMSTLKYMGYDGGKYNLSSSAMDVTYWFASAFMLNGGYDRDFKEGEIRLIELPVYSMEGQYTEEQYAFKTGWGDIIGVTSEDEAITYFEGDIDAYIEDSEEDDRDYGDAFDVENVVVQETTYIKFKPEWVGL